MENILTFDDIQGNTVDISLNSKKYICCICQSFLLMSPVYLSPDRGFICGYCYQYKKHFLEEGEILLPQNLYEDFALWIRFPCDFCEYFTVFNAPGASHEIQCKKRVFKCPMSILNRFFIGNEEPCEWEDKDGKTMVPHVKSSHEKLLMRKPFELSIKDMKKGNEERRIYLVTLTNRRLVVILTEYDEEENCVFLRCRSNKPGYPNLNTQCQIVFKIAGDNLYPMLVNVFPIGAKVMERGSDFCTLYLDRLDPEEVVQFSFEPSPSEKGLMGNTELDFAYDHDYWY